MIFDTSVYRQMVASLGSEYLFTSLGLDVVGICSITSAQLLRELSLDTVVTGTVPSNVVQLSVFNLTSYYGMDTSVSSGLSQGDAAQCKHWKVLIAAVMGAPASRIVLFQVCETRLVSVSIRMQCRRSPSKHLPLHLQLQEDEAETAALEYGRKKDVYTNNA
ncbi:MAG: hypothetical protein HC767_02300 [Akkermansiaceae bacterium]|nr:hypothetical protein [Akkermansiaceae bacterium]